MKISLVAGPDPTAPGLAGRLAGDGHAVTVLVDDAARAEEVRAAGADPVVLDLAATSATRVTEAFGGPEAVVLCADAGDAAALVVDAAQLGGILRFVMVSAVGTDATPGETAVRASALNWTILPPGDPDVVADALR